MSISTGQSRRERNGPAQANPQTSHQRRRSLLQSESEQRDEEFFARHNILDSARDAAAEVSEEDFVASLKSTKDSLEPIREEIRKSRKPRLRTVEQYLCDNCDRIISSPSGGFVVHGNIYVADPTINGGLIGNNFPETDEPVSLDCVKRTVLCKSCFIEAVGLGSSHNYETDMDRVIEDLSGTSARPRPRHDDGQAF